MSYYTLSIPKVAVVERFNSYLLLVEIIRYSFLVLTCILLRYFIAVKLYWSYFLDIWPFTRARKRKLHRYLLTSVVITSNSFVLQFVLPYLLIRDPFTSLKEVMLLYQCVTWLVILRLWSLGVSHLVGCPRVGYTVTTVSLNCLEFVSLILITTSALRLTC